MDEIIKSFQSPAWWVCVVIVSFIVNVLAAYAKSLFDRMGARLSGRLRIRQGVAATLFQKNVKDILSEPDGLVIVSLEEVKAMLMAMLSLLIASVLAVLPAVWFEPGSHAYTWRLPCHILSLIALLIGLVCLLISEQKARLREATKRQRKRSSATSS